MRAVPLFAGCLIAAAAGAAAAQPAADAQAPAPQAPSGQAPEQQQEQEQEQPPRPVADPVPPLPPPPAPAEARTDAAWQLYHEAFGALIQEKTARAAGLAARLRREHAGHPAAARVAASPLALVRAGELRRKALREAPSSGASSELALFQTLHGMALGIELCIALECDSGEAYFGLSLGGGAAGAILSLRAIPRITSGQRALLNSGTMWGAYNAITAIIAIDPDDDRGIAVGLILGQAAGFAAGALLFERRPTAGQVGLATSGGQWAAVLMGLTLTAASTGVREKEYAASLLVAADVGIAMGAYAATLRPDISRAQTYVIDAGAIAGGVVGGGLGIMLSGSIEDRTTAAMAALGVAAGLGAAAYFTRDWGDAGDAGGDGARAVVMPAAQGRGGVVGLAGTW